MANPYASQLKTLVFDIETMGLSPAKDMIINAGFCDPVTMETKQLFAESPADEERLLKDILAILAECDAVITYNGDSFDLPFVKTRCRKYGIDSMPLFWSIDMYRYLRSYWPMAKQLKHLNQKSVEFALGLSDDRTDEIGGGECITQYTAYLMNHDNECKHLILLHNADDVKQLARIYNASVFLPFDQIAFEKGFGISGPQFVLCKSIRLDRDCVFVEAEKQPGGIPSMIYEDSYELEYDCMTGIIKLKIFCQRKDEKSLFVDLHKLPCHISDFNGLSGFHSDFLVLSDGSGVLYRELNALAAGILSSGNLF